MPPSMWKSACRIPYASLSIQYNVSNHIYAHQHSGARIIGAVMLLCC